MNSIFISFNDSCILYFVVYLFKNKNKIFIYSSKIQNFKGYKIN